MCSIQSKEIGPFLYIRLHVCMAVIISNLFGIVYIYKTGELFYSDMKSRLKHSYMRLTLTTFPDISVIILRNQNVKKNMQHVHVAIW